jgi:hypothetical protein
MGRADAKGVWRLPVTERFFYRLLFGYASRYAKPHKRDDRKGEAQRVLPDYNAACPHSSAIDAGNRKNPIA